MPFEDLRDFLNYLGEKGCLLRVQKEVDSRFEIAAYIRKTSDHRGPALLFEHVKGFPTRVAGGLFATLRGPAFALQCDVDDLNDRIIEGARSPISPLLVRDGPCKEVIYKGKDVDLNTLPVPVYSEKDSGPYITMGVTISKDPETGARNMGIYRNELKGKNRLGISAQELYRHLAKAEAKGSGLPVAIALGVDPALIIGACWKAPYGIDEISIASGFRGAPVQMVKAETSNLEVPATAEIVIEGIVLPNVRETEGPFGEYAGYYNPPKPKPVIEVTAITHRCDPIFLAGLTGMPTTENHILKQVCLEASYGWELKQKFAGFRALHLPPAGSHGLLAIISMRPMSKSEARHVITYMLGNRPSLKCVIVVDDDVDIHNIEQVMWTVMTRFQPARDVMVVSDLIPAALDPSGPRGVASDDVEGSDVDASAIGIDATRPYGKPFPEVVRIPGVERVPDLVKRP
jgi:4-hydroxy-3-polyprenylbenzoate decarboxylase/2,5-furandicarboxylate decarboxylase 1